MQELYSQMKVKLQTPSRRWNLHQLQEYKRKRICTFCGLASIFKDTALSHLCFGLIKHFSLTKYACPS